MEKARAGKAVSTSQESSSDTGDPDFSSSVPDHDDVISDDDVRRGQTYILGGEAWMDYVCGHTPESEPDWLKLLIRRRESDRDRVHTLAILALSVVGSLDALTNRLTDLIIATQPKSTTRASTLDRGCVVQVSQPLGWLAVAEEVGGSLSLCVRSTASTGRDFSATVIIVCEETGAPMPPISFVIRNSTASVPLNLPVATGLRLRLSLFVEIPNPIFG